MEKLLRVCEAGERLGLATSTIRQMIYDGRLPRVKIGRAVRIRERRVATFSQYLLAAITGIDQKRISLLERDLVKAKPEERARSPPASDSTVGPALPTD